MAKKVEKSSPRRKQAEVMATAGTIWMIMCKTGWLYGFPKYLMIHDRAFFYDGEIAGLCVLCIAWLLKEVRELFG